MAAYNFKRESNLYLVSDPAGTPLQYLLDISEIEFSQTLMETSFNTRTLHSEEMFEDSVIDKANPANFSFTIPAIREADLHIVLTKALNCTEFDLYISSTFDVFRVRNCVITNIEFIIERLRPLSISVSGQASEVSKVGATGSYVIPGAVQPRSGSRTYNQVNYVSITLGNSGSLRVLDSDLQSVTVNLINEISWNPYETVGACGVQDVISYPTSFTIKSKKLVGEITQYITGVNILDLLGYELNVPLHIIAGQNVSGTIYGFDIDIPGAAFINRVNPREVFTQTYDWRMVSNPENLSDVITYITI